MIVGAKYVDLSDSEFADLLGFPCTTIFRVYRKWFDKEFVGKNVLLMPDVRGEMTDQVS